MSRMFIKMDPKQHESPDGGTGSATGTALGTGGTDATGGATSPASRLEDEGDRTGKWMEMGISFSMNHRKSWEIHNSRAFSS